MECGFFSFFLFFLFYFSWPLFFCFLICAPIVHPQCTRFGNLFIINNILTLFIKKKKAFFSRFASLGKILTTDNLRKQRVLVLDWCYMCKKCGESVDHLLLHCPIACEMWSLVFCLFGIHWVMPQKVIELFESWQGKFGRHRNIELWRIVPHCLLWCIWCERNARSFEGCERSMLEFKSFFLHTLLDWSVVFCHFSCSSLPVLFDRCNLGYWFMPP